jgi:hypothetical protein
MSAPKGDRLKLFWAKVDKSGDCWLWTSILSHNGYGRFWDGDRFVQAHRFSYELAGGQIPDGYHVDHLCRTRACIRPDHLEAVTPRENTMRTLNVVAVNARKDRCESGHEFTAENTYHPPGRVRRQCRTCMRASTRRWRARQKTAS